MTFCGSPRAMPIRCAPRPCRARIVSVRSASEHLLSAKRNTFERSRRNTFSATSRRGRADASRGRWRVALSRTAPRGPSGPGGREPQRCPVEPGQESAALTTSRPAGSGRAAAELASTYTAVVRDAAVPRDLRDRLQGRSRARRWQTLATGNGRPYGKAHRVPGDGGIVTVEEFWSPPPIRKGFASCTACDTRW
jgi:hypothetical protein